MLLATTILLLVFRLPSAIISVTWLISAKMFIHEKPPFPFRKFHSIANLCATLNSATTFIMFMIYGKKFRSEFTRIYCCCFKKLKRQNKRIVINREDDDVHHHQQRQINQLITNNKQRNSSSNQSFHLDTLRPSNTPTTSTSIGPFLSIRHSDNSSSNKIRNSHDRQSDTIVSNKNLNVQQHQYEHNNQNDHTRSTSLPISSNNWFKNLFHFR